MQTLKVLDATPAIEDGWADLEEELTRLLDLPNSEGDPEDPSFIRCTENTVRRAAEILRHLAVEAKTRLHKPPIPTTGVGPKGSVDIYWSGTAKELLVNVPAGGEDPFAYYGDDRASTKLNGTVGAGCSVLFLASWLVE